MENQIFEFHISRHSREKYGFDQSLFEFDGSAVLGSFHTSRLLASKVNEQKDLINYPETAAKASEIYAAGLMDEIFHLLFKLYKQTIPGEIWNEAYGYLLENLPSNDVEQTIESFLKDFPPKKVYQQKLNIAEYISELHKNNNYGSVLEEIILLWVENQNPALDTYKELFIDKSLADNTKYKTIIDTLIIYFDKKPLFGPDNQNMIQMLRTPAIIAPNSIHQQLEFIRTRWGGLLGDLLYRLISGIDFLKEEHRPSFTGPGKNTVPGYKEVWDRDSENFSPDKEWMPSLVLLAKNTFVWLDQIRKKYNVSIKTIDQIPDQELDRIRERGFNGLWLIGLWERSNASEKIKQLCGNPEAIASAYSLAGYQIATELGGEDAYQRLKERAWQRGIRLAADMVPNHMGIDSNWLYEHPDWFVQLNYSPFPSYSFNGENLSKYPGYEIKIEDHYYDRTDAAVVFLFKNHNSPETRFIYHGNDGTTMPWNDTAQLNYLIPEVREAVYQTILSVAKRFPIIRFDAAMTLAKKHYQRLWFPEPGTGGAIPSRAEFGLSKSQFDQLMPSEFWREVVDRLANDAPDTLLLAEAFWLMESYFVRTLGMHRVYNSAFMNMLRNEDNANYRQLIKNTIEFDPQILKRFVNFMNNPDEKTSVDQFGKGDKYFGICTLMSTLPGLPMFGHGQFEGYSEKYGMEYKKAYWDEEEDQNLITRHQNQISPLLHKRYIFSEVDHFLLYDFYISDTSINDDVYIYSNYNEGQASLVIYNNKFANVSGFIKESATRLQLEENGKTTFRTVNILQGLKLSNDYDFVIFRDISSNLEFIRSIKIIQQNGLHFDLNAYQTLVLLEFRQVKDDEWQSYRRLSEYLGGNGVPNIEESMAELLVQPIHTPLREILNHGYFDYLLSQRIYKKNNLVKQQVFIEAEQKIDNLFQGIYHFTGQSQDKDIVTQQTIRMLEFLLSIPIFETKFMILKNKSLQSLLTNFQKDLFAQTNSWIISLIYIFLSRIGELGEFNDTCMQNQTWFEEWKISKIIRDLCISYNLEDPDQSEINQLIFTLLGFSHWHKNVLIKEFEVWFKKILNRQDIQSFLNVNRYQGQLWFSKERYETLTNWLVAIAIIEIASDPKISTNLLIEKFMNLAKIQQLFIERLEKSQFLFANLI